MTQPRLLAYGPGALFAEYTSLSDVLAVARRVAAADVPGVIDVVPAARTVLVTHRGGADRDLLQQLLLAPIDASPDAVADATAAAEEEVEVEVNYGGPDLDGVAASCGMSVDEVVRRHAAPVYTAAFCGFMPGFSYLIGLDPLLVLPRLATPRWRVEPGSVAIASEYSAVYPAASPGGWHLLGHTDAVLWDETRSIPALMPPGASVRFVAR
ncbi:MAG: carboxyltransferase domain-containing protein [Actinomycetota bacterium]|jgi:KipI family sensor histidine kinase inhibitor